MVWFQMAVRAPAVRMRSTEFDVDQVQSPVTHSALGDDLVRELAHPFD